MSLLSRSKLLRTTLLGGVVTLFVTSFLPIWFVWFEYPREGLGYETWLWGCLFYVTVGMFLSSADPGYTTRIVLDWRDALIAFAAFGIGCLIGAGFHLLRRFTQQV